MQKADQACFLLLEDLSEQLESVPMITEPVTGVKATRNSSRKQIHSKKSSSLPLVGAYREITRTLLQLEVSKRIAANLSFVVGISVTA